MVTARQREVFDRLLDGVIGGLPPGLAELLEEVPLIVEDEPTAEVLRELGFGPDEELCGLHSGIALTERSVEAPAGPALPDHMMIFRGPILRMVGYGEGGGEGGAGRRAVRDLEEEIRITVLHEIGHHFGLDEDDLAELGYD